MVWIISNTCSTSTGARPIDGSSIRSKRGFAISQWVDRTVTRIRGHKVSPTWGRPLADWVAVLQRLEFRVQSIPMSEGTPFANVLLVADLQPAP